MKNLTIRRFLIAFAVLAAYAAPTVIGQSYRPPPGGDDYYQFSSPAALGTGFRVTDESGPSASRVNPAVAGFADLGAFELSYLTLIGLSDIEPGWSGQVINAGARVVRPIGVFSGSASFLYSGFAAVLPGTRVDGHFSFAKDIWPDLALGAGARATIGEGDQFDVGLALDLGAYGRPGDFAGLKNVELGVGFLNIGKWFTPTSGRTATPSPFTPVVGAAFDLVDGEDARIRVGADVSFPAFQNVRLNLGARLAIREIFDISTGFQLDAQQILNQEVAPRSLIPSFSIGFSTQTDPSRRSEATNRDSHGFGPISARVAAAPLYSGVWGFGAGVHVVTERPDIDPPTIVTGFDEPLYISPNNSGIQDSLEVPLTIVDDGVIASYEIRIEAEDGTVVRRFSARAREVESSGVQFVIDRLVYQPQDVAVPRSIRWDGRSDAGRVVPDGRYNVVIIAEDRVGNVATKGPLPVIVDTTPPHVSIDPIPPDERVFSPNSDGSRDSITFEQTGSVERLWRGEILNTDGDIVFSREWKDSPPESFTWDGIDADGQVVPDGVYSYRISATDRAGNSFETGVPNLIVNTEPTPIAVTTDISFFSPNGNGVRDSVSFYLDVPTASGVMNWQLVFQTSSGVAVRTISGRDHPPTEVVFNGRGDDGRVLPEGRYNAALNVLYRNGNSPRMVSPDVILDLTPPNADVRVDYTIFSPNGDGVRDFITFFQETSLQDEWVGRVETTAGETIREFRWPGTADIAHRWNGQRDDGRLAADGSYVYNLESTDRAGNTGRARPIAFVLDTEAAEALITAEFDAFSPNASGVRDRIRFFPQIQRNSDVVSYSFEVIDENDDVARTVRGSGPVPATVTWDGLDGLGRRLPDGVYRARISVTYRNASESSARTAAFSLDTEFPSIRVSTPYTLFSPDGDGRRDTIRVSQQSSSESAWEGTITRVETGTVVRRFVWPGEVEDFTWDGTDDAGNLVPDGEYRYDVYATDRAGNRTVETIEGIRVDTRPTPVFVTVDASGFAPNGNGLFDTVGITTFANVVDGIDRWVLRIRHESGTVERMYTGEELQPRSQITWDGRGTTGRVREGYYTAEFEVNYEKGNRAVATTSRFLLDVSPPDVRVSLDPVPFSPDGDGVDDELAISIAIDNRSEIQAWRMEIRDQRGGYFTEFSGRGRPASVITWDGRAIDGELVRSAEDYPYALEVVDVLGNRRSVSGVIPVDILVVRDGDRLKVQISNINFLPESAALVLDSTTPTGAKNLEVMNRLAEIFTRYDQYRILVEGHAVNVSGTEQEDRDVRVPLSRNRAQSVKDALVERGISAPRISIEGKGGSVPIVPHTDIENRWQNRRVEFILIR